MISDVNAHYVLILLLNAQMLYCQPIASGRCSQVHRDCTQVHTVEDRTPLFPLCAFPAMSVLFRVMYPQIIKNEEHLLYAVMYKSSHKINQFIGIHIILVQHKSQLASLGNS